MARTRNHTKWSMAGVLVTLLLSLLPGTALAGTDDYPAQWRNAAQDSLVDTWRYYNRECTSFVAWRLHSRNGYEMPAAIGNAGQWGPWFQGHAPGVAVDNTPAVGAIAESSGHVAWVEAVNGNQITIEEYNFSNNGTYNERIVAASTFHYIHPKDLGGSNDLFFVKTKNTGSGRVEAFTATAASGFSTGVSSPTRFSPGDADNGWFGLLPNTDLYFVKTKNTGSGRVEAFTASRDSGYQSGVSSATRFSPGDANNGWFGLLPNTDLYFVKSKNTGSGRVEAFTATRASGYQSGISSVVPRFSPGDADNGWFGLLPNGDVYFVKTKNTGSGRVEAFTATASSGYQTGISSTTRFSPGDASNGWFRMLPNNDVYFVKTRNTGSGKVEVHTATRASNYQSGISSAAPRFSPGDANNGWFGLLG